MLQLAAADLGLHRDQPEELLCLIAALLFGFPHTRGFANALIGRRLRASQLLAFVGALSPAAFASGLLATLDLALSASLSGVLGHEYPGGYATELRAAVARCGLRRFWRFARIGGLTLIAPLYLVTSLR